MGDLTGIFSPMGATMGRPPRAGEATERRRQNRFLSHGPDAVQHDPKKPWKRV